MELNRGTNGHIPSFLASSGDLKPYSMTCSSSEGMLGSMPQKRYYNCFLEFMLVISAKTSIFYSNLFLRNRLWIRMTLLIRISPMTSFMRSSGWNLDLMRSTQLTNHFYVAFPSSSRIFPPVQNQVRSLRMDILLTSLNLLLTESNTESIWFISSFLRSYSS